MKTAVVTARSAYSPSYSIKETPTRVLHWSICQAPLPPTLSSPSQAAFLSGLSLVLGSLSERPLGRWIWMQVHNWYPRTAVSLPSLARPDSTPFSPRVGLQSAYDATKYIWCEAKSSLGVYLCKLHPDSLQLWQKDSKYKKNLVLGFKISPLYNFKYLFLKSWRAQSSRVDPI